MKTLHEGHYRMDDEGAVWIDVRGFAVNIFSTGEGIMVDVYDKEDLANDVNSQPLASNTLDDLV
jgi:hypothetical protein